MSCPQIGQTESASLPESRSIDISKAPEYRICAPIITTDTHNGALMHWEIGGTSPGTLRSFRPLIWTNARLARMWTKRSLPGPTARRFSAVISPSPTCIYRRASQSFSRMSAYFRVVFNKLFAFSPHPTPIIHLTPRPFVIHYKGARSWYG